MTAKTAFLWLIMGNSGKHEQFSNQLTLKRSLFRKTNIYCRMSMEDYTKSFKNMDICCLSPDFLNGSSKCSWSSQYHIGQWTAETAGGISTYTPDHNSKQFFYVKVDICIELPRYKWLKLHGFIGSVWKNPQFRVKIEKPGEDCAGGEYPENILVSLMQNRENRHRKQNPHLFIGFFVYEVSLRWDFYI